MSDQKTILDLAPRERLAEVLRTLPEHADHVTMRSLLQAANLDCGEVEVQTRRHFHDGKMHVHKVRLLPVYAPELGRVVMDVLHLNPE